VCHQGDLEEHVKKESNLLFDVSPKGDFLFSSPEIIVEAAWRLQKARWYRRESNQQAKKQMADYKALVSFSSFCGGRFTRAFFVPVLSNPRVMRPEGLEKGGIWTTGNKL